MFNRFRCCTVCVRMFTYSMADIIGMYGKKL